MMSEFGELREALDALLTRLRRDSEHGDAAVEGLNDRLRRLYDTGILGETVIMGPVVLTRPFSLGGRPDGSQAIQAVLTLPAGFGAVYWDSEAWHDIENDADREALAHIWVNPYESCEAAVRALLAPHVTGLLRCLLGSIDLWQQPF
ncbi:hypothetical protein [Zavarzinella formosa]|uniref:hypothetical protein n=1 Tax=Zavarzinella formosa TaxID=360055 RepID=UPI0012FA3B6F|nr:hypothetical protein [Zavarzinella formosa]